MARGIVRFAPFAGLVGLVAVLLVACGGPAPTTLSITPASTTLLPGETREFAATGTFSDAGEISWSSPGGTITGSGRRVTYTAPASLGADRISAVLGGDATVTAVAEVDVVAELEPPADPTLDPSADERHLTIVGPSDFTPPLAPLFVDGFGPDGQVGPLAVVRGVPWASQVPPYNLATSANCGPASFLMLEAFYRGTSLTQASMDGKVRAIVDWLDANVVEYHAPHRPGIEYYNGGNTGAWMLERLARARGFTNALHAVGSSMEILKQHVAQNQPVIVRVHWQRGAHAGDEMVETGFGHYAVVVGMDSQYVYLNDPGVTWAQQSPSPGLNYGAYRRYTIESFRRVWEAGPSGLRNVALFVPVTGAATPVGIDARSLELPQARLGAPYAATLAGSGGHHPYTWSVFRGGLPAGLALTADGRIAGTPATAGAHDFWVRVQDSVGNVAEAEASLTVAAAAEPPALAIHSAPILPLAQVGSAYLVSLSASGGSLPYRWSVASGSLPSGLTLSQDGAVRGTPTRHGVHAFTIRLRDDSASPQAVERRFTLSVMPASTEVPPDAGADLIVSGLGVTPSAAAAGSNVTVAFHVVNVGDAPAGSSTVRVRITADPSRVTTADTLLAELATTALAAGQSQAYARTVTLPAGLAGGTHYVWVTADVFNQAHQSNFGNDHGVAPIVIGGTTPPTMAPATIAAGDDHSLALGPNGTVWAWGGNWSGQLGDGTTTERHEPVQVEGLNDVTSITVGDGHSLALRSDGNVWAWGLNEFGQLGDGTTTERHEPVRVSGLTNVTSITAAAWHSLALRSDGTVWAWGYNYSGQLGDGTTTERHAPVQVSGLTNVSSIATGWGHSLALRSDGTVWAWGYNEYAQLGDGTTTERRAPVQVSGLTNVTRVSPGPYHSLALRTNGTVWAWGANWYGQLGDGTTTARHAPVQVSALTNVTDISAGGSNYSLALRTDGTAWAWGTNDVGQLGDGSSAERRAPVQVSGLTSVTGISAGGYHSLALRTNGTVWGWGANWYGQLGDGTTTDRRAPVQVGGF